jgi:hypothetical protein
MHPGRRLRQDDSPDAALAPRKEATNARTVAPPGRGDRPAGPNEPRRAASPLPRPSDQRPSATLGVVPSACLSRDEGEDAVGRLALEHEIGLDDRDRERALDRLALQDRGGHERPGRVGDRDRHREVDRLARSLEVVRSDDPLRTVGDHAALLRGGGRGGQPDGGDSGDGGEDDAAAHGKAPANVCGKRIESYPGLRGGALRGFTTPRGARTRSVSVLKARDRNSWRATACDRDARVTHHATHHPAHHAMHRDFDTRDALRHQQVVMTESRLTSGTTARVVNLVNLP